MSQFPFDIWFEIASHLAIRDIAALQSTSKTLYSLLQEESVWCTALRDVRLVKPLPLPYTSLDDARGACVNVARVDKVFTREEVSPKLEAELEGHDYSTVQLLPGGQRFIGTNFTGELHLGSIETGILDKIPGPQPPPGNSQFRILAIAPHEVLMLHAVHWCNSDAPEDDCGLEFRLYHVREKMQFLGSFQPEDPQNTVYYTLYQTPQGPALVYLQGAANRQFLARIRLIDLDTNAIRPAVVVRLRGWIVPSYLQDFVLLYGSVVLFGPDRLVLATSCGIYLYKVPNLDTLIRTSDGCMDGNVIDVFPTWSTCGAWAISTPLLSPPVIYGEAIAKPRARCAIWTGHDMHILDVPLREGPCDFIQFWSARINKDYTHQTLQAVGHSLGVYRHRSKEMPSAMVCLTVKHGDERGYVRLGREPNALREVKLKWEDQSCLMDLSVDDVSGKIAVLEWANGDESSVKRLKVYSIV
ncbi:hypothetical protein NM688_g6946 [Phlebia brevispora]|uniref:Uncharacterized protein n=1 Tax=Phlebia brevispora TaxID=194682 RepID=A0ACC1SAT0_9APHY|nr:hypothetical protein NM688_g6946 [Phlebia brevispora]